jgi:ComF family protein
MHALLRTQLALFPPACRRCGRLLAPPGRRTPSAAPSGAPSAYPYLCAACHAELPWQEGADAAPPPGVARVWAACRYDDPVSGWIQLLKYGRNDGLSRLLAALLEEALAAHGDLPEAHLLVPVPLHPLRLWQRGFNQSLLLARDWLRRSAALPVAAPRLATRVLVRSRHTRPQVSVSGAERRSNVAGAFALHPRLAREPAPLRGQRVLLCDDVTTTGSTLAACAEPLLAAGAERVEALVLARA